MTQSFAQMEVEDRETSAYVCLRGEFPEFRHAFLGGSVSECVNCNLPLDDYEAVQRTDPKFNENCFLVIREMCKKHLYREVAIARKEERERLNELGRMKEEEALKRAKRNRMEEQEADKRSYRPDARNACEVRVGSPGTEFNFFEIEVPKEHTTDQVVEVFTNYLPEAMRLFASKNTAYRAGSNNGVDRFGVAGQFMKLADKVDKLEKPLWIDHGKGEELPHEGVMEVLQDMFGHVMLTMLKYDQARREM